MTYHDQRTIPAPDTTPAFQYPSGYGYEVPSEIVRWEWSTTFGRWGAVVIFEDGKRAFSYPQQEGA